MDKKGIIAISLAILVMAVWQVKFAPKYAPQQPPTPAGAENAATPAASAASTGTGAATASATATPGAEIKAAPSESSAAISGTAGAPVTSAAESETKQAPQTVKAEAESVEYEFTNMGGGIAKATLLKHKAEDDHSVVLNGDGPTPIGAISEKAGEEPDGSYDVLADHKPGEIAFQRTNSKGLQITKKFTLPAKGAKGAEEYLVLLDCTFKNVGQQSYLADSYFIHVGASAPIHPKDLAIYTGFDWFGDDKAKETGVQWFEPGRIPLIGIQTSPAKDIYADKANSVLWAGVKDQYFTTLAITGTASPGNSVWARRLPLKRDDVNVFGMDGALGMPGFKLAPGEEHHQQVKIYIGPKEFSRLEALGLGGGEAQLMQWGMFKVVSKFLLSSMNLLKSWLGSYALAIIVLTLVIKSLLWPIQNRSTASMKKMQALQPKMNELKEKYKDDPARMNQEVMKLYKDYGVNPVSGCLPMFIQIPIFFGFYSMLGTAIELRNSRFLWVKDLSQPDTIAHLGPIAINILPLCMAATMLIQMRMTPKSGDPAQQKIMMFVPLIFIWFCYNYASALALYWAIQNLFSIVQLYVTNKQTTPELKKIVVPKRKK